MLEFEIRLTVSVTGVEPDPGEAGFGLGEQAVFVGKFEQVSPTEPVNPAVPETVKLYVAGLDVVSVPVAAAPAGVGKVKSVPVPVSG
jgi:hypothetical protein